MPRKKKIEETSDEIIIKRYGNRRLYNTETKSYVNYEELAKLVRDGKTLRSLIQPPKKMSPKPC